MRLLLVVALSPLTVTACMAPPPTASATIALEPTAVLASSSAVGGLCPDAVCSTTFTVHADGTWNLTTGETVVGGGILPTQVLSDLAAATSSTTLLSAPAFTGTCPTAYDGAELIYTWTDPEGIAHTVSACERAVPEDDPLVVALAAAAPGQSTRPSAVPPQPPDVG